MRPILFLVVLLFLLPPSPVLGSPSLVGSWQFKNGQMEVVAEFLPDGTFRQVTNSTQGRETLSGRFQLNGQMLFLLPQGAQQPFQLIFRFSDADTILATYPSGETLQWKRVKGTSSPDKPPKAPEPQPGAASKAPAGPAASSSPAGKRPTLLMQRVWEPNEKAFTFLVPKGWNFKGGIFNVNPLTQNGPGNSIAPKCDLAVKKDDGGTVMIRFAPPWNYADLTYSPTGASLFKPGQYYQGMLVKPLPTPKQFLTEMFQTTRPQATQVTVIAEDPMREMVEAIYRSNQQANQQLQQMGLKPNRYEGLAMLVEYSEGGQRFREVLKTVITDSRTGAFMWTNEQTIQFRAPAGEFEAWKPALDVIYNSIELNPQWIAAVTKAMDQRAKMALETQRYINKVNNEILENRRRTHAEIRYENYLFLSGQDEYVNPFTKKVELDTSAYRHRWMNNQGEILYTDENSHNPNEYEKRPNLEWKQTPARPR
jgi:hypothetical protein